MNEPVEMRPAFEWTCPECGTNHYASGIVVESPDVQEELSESHGIDISEDGRWMLMPEQVQCDDCGDSFKTRHFWDDDNEP